jgi:hypothetical protein
VDLGASLDPKVVKVVNQSHLISQVSAEQLFV